MVKNISHIPQQKVQNGIDTYKQILIGPDQGPNFAMRRFIINPGGSMPNHTNTVEHEQFILNGRAQIGIGEAVFEVKKNDVVFIPAGVPHWYRTKGDQAFEFLCMVPNKDDHVEIIK